MSPAEQMRAAAARMRRYNTRFWAELADWLAKHAEDLADADGYASSCDSPADVEHAHLVARAFLQGGA